jgi:gluconokinase
VVIVVFGVSGAGKTTIGRLLSAQLAWDFVDADDFHPRSNREKMQLGIALTDSDRRSWLAALRAAIAGWVKEGRDVVLACSALKRSYRERLHVSSDVRFVYLQVARDVIEQRLEARIGHFASSNILPGQFADLEEPGAGEPAVSVDGSLAPPEVVAAVRSALDLG